jgi:hypothetical protein
MITTLLVTAVDFFIDYFVFSYQRGTLLISRMMEPNGNKKNWSFIQAELSPTWLGIIAILNYGTLIFALFLLWQQTWWYSVAYLIIRLFIGGFIPTFDRKWAKIIINKYKNKEFGKHSSNGIALQLVIDSQIRDGLEKVKKALS